MGLTCRFHPDRPAVAVIETDRHQALTRRKGGLDEIPVCAECLRRWRKTRVLQGVKE